MIVNEEFLSKLRRSFGLNLYEVKLWTALLSRGVSTAGELSDIADVPRSRTYDVLESLERKGFVVVKPEKPIRYLAIAPNEVLEREIDIDLKMIPQDLSTAVQFNSEQLKPIFLWFKDQLVILLKNGPRLSRPARWAPRSRPS